MKTKYWIAALLGLGGLAVSRKLRRMSMSLDRVNREYRNQNYPRVTRRDVEYMRRVRERMMLGKDCTHPPLYS